MEEQMAAQDDRTSNPARMRQLASEDPDRVALIHVAPDGTESSFTWAELDRRSSQVAGALAERGLGLRLTGSRRSASPNVASWCSARSRVLEGGRVHRRLLRWDLPDWERDRLREVVDAKVHLDETDLDSIDATADSPVPDLPDVVSPSLNGICSSGSTGTPKVIQLSWPAVYNEAFSTPMVNQWYEVPTPQVVLVLAPMYHTNGFVTLLSLLGGDQLVLLQKFDAERIVDVIERHRVSTFTATPTMLKRIADVPGVDARDLSSLEWILQGAAPMPPSLVDRWAGLIGEKRYASWRTA
ncbi:MAG: class I adenylate-forming enzyme family protein [Acidimicrobiia bacterium]|nr:class I adenylate-forming enzyme family protein [Acidimicrobiia bacterium]